MHIMIQTICPINIKVVTLRGKDQNGRKFRVTIQGPDALEDVAEVDIEGLTHNNYLLAFKARPRW
jgi:S1-C subfamily serine protease